MLRALTGKRGEIARCMTFSLEHAEAAHEVRTLSFRSETVSDVIALGCRHHCLIVASG